MSTQFREKSGDETRGSAAGVIQSRENKLQSQRGWDSTVLIDLGAGYIAANGDCRMIEICNHSEKSVWTQFREKSGDDPGTAPPGVIQ